ncbi:MAG: hypothetical protein ACTSR8_19880 [Promethearchaeota archaeon]
MYRCKECGVQIDYHQFKNHQSICSECIHISILSKTKQLRKKSSICISIGIAGLILTPFLLLLIIPSNSDYVGVSEEQEYIWEIDFYQLVNEKYKEDTGDDSLYTPIMTHEKIKVKIVKINNEREYDVNDLLKNKTYKNRNGVKLDLEFYYYSSISFEFKWLLMEDYNNTVIYEFEPELFSTILVVGNIFISNDVDFSLAGNYISHYYEDVLHYELTIEYPEENSIDITFNELNNTKQIDIKSSYTPEGVLEKFEYYYDEQILFSWNLVFDANSYNRTIVIVEMIIMGIISLGFLLIGRYYLRAKLKFNILKVNT